MKKSIVTLIAVYAVFTQGLILVVASFMEKNTVDTFVVFFSGAIVLGIVLFCAKMLKRIFKVKRPEKQETLFTPLDSYAFPSGHATGLSAMTVFIFEKNLVLGLVSLILAGLVLFARVRSQVHDYTDIVGGVVLGSTLSYFLSPLVEQFVVTILITHIFL